MLGRFAGPKTIADVGISNVLKVAAAAALLISAAVAKYVLHLPEGVVIGFAVGSLCLTGFPVIWSAVRGLLQFTTNVDELVSLAIIASMILGEWISAAVVAWIMVLGGLIEQFTSQRARRHIEKLVSANPDHALVIGEQGEENRVPVDRLQAGQLILVRPGDVIAADGSLEDGESTVDESMLTGESVPVDRAAGDRVSAGTVNGEGSLKIRVERVGRESTQGKIIQLVQEAEQHRAPILRVAEKYAKWFTPTILSLAVIVWIVSGDPLRAVTILIVGCPCAFVLATPTAVIAALGRASKQGVLVKGGKFLEACSKIDLLAFDKTGTLTTGNCRIREVVALNGMTEHQVLFHAARLEAGAEHPLARAIVDHARACGMDLPDAATIRREAGMGVSEIAERPWRIGSQRFLQRQDIVFSANILTQADSFHQQGFSVLFLSQGETLRGLFIVDDQLREEAANTLVELQKMGYEEIYVLTGDSATVANRVAESVGVPPHRILSQLLPEQKYRCLEDFEATGHRVGFIGDGTNDGPALARATVGISIGSRENTVALETADIVLMRDGFANLPFLLRLSRTTTRTINQNLLLFGLLFNATMLTLSGLGILTPIMGAIGHNLGSVAVVLNSARLLRIRGK